MLDSDEDPRYNTIYSYSSHISGRQRIIVIFPTILDPILTLRIRVQVEQKEGISLRTLLVLVVSLSASDTGGSRGGGGEGGRPPPPAPLGRFFFFF